MRVPLPRGRAALAVFTVLLAGTLPGAQASVSVLFPEPLHLTREISDSISGATVRLDEYCVGQRVVSVRGERSSIADYRAGTLTEIDRGAGTYSVTSFDAIARAKLDQAASSRRDAGKGGSAELMEDGVRAVGARTGRLFRSRIDTPQSTTTVEVVIDQQITLSREAAEVLLGAAYPSSRTLESDLTLQAAGRTGDTSRTLPGTAARYALPLEQAIAWQIDGESVRSTSRVVRVGGELPPVDAVAIPPGARLVESPIVLRKKMLDELERLPSSPSTGAP